MFIFSRHYKGRANKKTGQNLFVAILFNSRGIDRSVEGGRERGIVCSLYLLGSNRAAQGFDLEIGRVKIDTSRGEDRS